MSNKERYRIWVEGQESLPIFLQPWWLDAVCAGKEWDVLLFYEEVQQPSTEETPQPSTEEAPQAATDVTQQLPTEETAQPAEVAVETEEPQPVEQEPQIRAALPYMVSKKWRSRYISMPELTQVGGLWLDEHHRWGAVELEHLCQNMAEQLQALDLIRYSQDFSIGSPCIEVLYKQGWKLKKNLAYRLENLSNLDKVIDAFSKNKKRQLQKSLSLHAQRGWSGEEFCRFTYECFKERKRQLPYSREFMLVIAQKARKHHQSEILTIRNADREVYAAALLVWDKTRLYLMMPTFLPSHHESGASALLVLEAIKIAREKGLRFDFAAPDDKHVLKDIKQFEPQAVPFYTVEKRYRWWAFLVR